MAIAENQDLQAYCEEVALNAKQAAAQLALATGEQKNTWLRESARSIRTQIDAILQANAKDIEAAPGFGLTSAQTDRLRLTPERIEAIALGMEEVAMLPDPIGEFIESTIRPNGLVSVECVCRWASSSSFTNPVRMSRPTQQRFASRAVTR